MNRQFFFFSKNIVFQVLLFVMLELVNVILMQSSLNLVLSLCQVVIVLSYVLKKRIDKAFFLHVVFSLTCCDATSASVEYQLLSYAEVKLFGPFTLSYIILGIIWLYSRNMPIAAPKDSFICRLRRIFIWMFLYGTIIGIGNLLLFSARLQDFIIPFIYLLSGILSIDILVRLYEEEYLESCYNTAIALLIAAPFVTFITYFVLNIRASYSEFDALIFNEEFMMAPLMLLLLFYKGNRKGLVLLSLAVYFVCIFTAGRGGFFLNSFVALVFVVFIVFNRKDIGYVKLRKAFRIIIPILCAVGFSYIGLISVESGVSLAGNKINEFLSMLSLFTSIGSGTGFALSDMSESPYTRIAETANIIYEGFSNPLALIFGHGYGGTYTDCTGMFKNIDVSQGAFSYEVARSGVFGTAHSFLPSTILFNGLFGLFLIIDIAFSYFKRIKYTPFVYAAYILFLYSFYFNPSLLLAALFALFVSEYKFNYVKESGYLNAGHEYSLKPDDNLSQRIKQNI